MNEELIAPCGMNCALCISYQAEKKDLNKKGFRKTYCPGCRPRGKNCTFMRRSCELVGKGLLQFCHECRDFPTPRHEGPGTPPDCRAAPPGTSATTLCGHLVALTGHLWHYHRAVFQRLVEGAGPVRGRCGAQAGPKPVAPPKRLGEAALRAS